MIGAYSYCVIKSLLRFGGICQGWRFSLVEAGCGSRIQGTWHRITVRSVCRGDHVGAGARRSPGAIPVVLRGDRNSDLAITKGEDGVAFIITPRCASPHTDS